MKIFTNSLAFSSIILTRIVLLFKFFCIPSWTLLDLVMLTHSCIYIYIHIYNIYWTWLADVFKVNQSWWKTEKWKWKHKNHKTKHKLNLCLLWISNILGLIKQSRIILFIFGIELEIPNLAGLIEYPWAILNQQFSLFIYILPSDYQAKKMQWITLISYTYMLQIFRMRCNPTEIFLLCITLLYGYESSFAIRATKWRIIDIWMICNFAGFKS